MIVGQDEGTLIENLGCRAVKFYVAFLIGSVFLWRWVSESFGRTSESHLRCMQ